MHAELLMLAFIYETEKKKKKAKTILLTTVVYVPGEVLFGDFREVVSSVTHGYETRNKETPVPSSSDICKCHKQNTWANF